VGSFLIIENLIIITIIIIIIIIKWLYFEIRHSPTKSYYSKASFCTVLILTIKEEKDKWQFHKLKIISQFN
jgi:hypothetical protein